MLLLSSISNKDVLFIFSANKVVAEEVPFVSLKLNRLYNLKLPVFKLSGE